MCSRVDVFRSLLRRDRWTQGELLMWSFHLNVKCSLGDETEVLYLVFVCSCRQECTFIPLKTFVKFSTSSEVTFSCQLDCRTKLQPHQGQINSKSDHF